jgi:fused signal recognition particle receptor
MLLDGIAKKLKALLFSRTIDGSFFQEIEDAMIEADMGVRTAAELTEGLREGVKKGEIKPEEMRGVLKGRVRGFLRVETVDAPPDGLTALLVLGVNGVGKTTTIAKLASYFIRERGILDILLAAGDTFRAAAIDQLSLHASRLGLPFVAQEPGSDPGAVIFDAISHAQAKGIRLLIADTAGRLHNKEALVKELMKIDKIMRGRLARGSYKKLLVLDATTGQNAFQQAEVFHKAVGIDSIILAKADSTAKGGMVVPICRELGLPFSFLGIGEKPDDLAAFDPERYLDSLFGKS